MSREVAVIDDVIEVHGTEPSGVTAWIAEQEIEHEHAWTAVGCWVEQQDSGWILSNLITPVLAGITPDEWLAYLDALPASSARDELRIASEGGAPTLDLFERIEAWQDSADR